MRKLPFAIALLAAPVMAQVADTVSNGSWHVGQSMEMGGTAVNPEAVLWDNGPLVTDPGAGFGGADASALQTAIGGNIYGYGHQVFYNYWVADDFTLTTTESITDFTFYCYQTGASTTSTITANNFQVYNAIPPAGLIYTNMGSTLVSNMWSNIYRVLDTNLTASNRAIMEVKVDATGVGTLGPGTYWIAWQHDGSLSSGPWVPPVTVKGTPGTGNGLQSLDGGASFNPLIDSGGLWPDDLKFIVEGGAPGLVLTVAGPCPGVMTFSYTGATPLANVAIAYGRVPGNTPVPPCPGLFLDLTVMGYRMTKADASGNGGLSASVPPFACGVIYVQAVDLAACVKSKLVGPL